MGIKTPFSPHLAHDAKNEVIGFVGCTWRNPALGFTRVADICAHFLEDLLVKIYTLSRYHGDKPNGHDSCNDLKG